MPEDFNEVKLTYEQIEELVYNERARIYFDLKSLQKKNILKNEEIEAKRLWSYNELKDFVLKNNPDFVLDEYSSPIFDMLCLYFTRDKKFESLGEGFSLYKSICLAGVPGCGKSRILEMFSINKRQCFHLISINDIQLDCKEKGIDRYKFYTAQVAGWGWLKKYFFQENVCWLIDDVGLEEPVNDYGNKAFVFSKIVQERYSNKILMQYFPQHITTMLNPEQLEEKYGTFVRSRMREQYNYIQYKGPDRRK